MVKVGTLYVLWGLRGDPITADRPICGPPLYIETKTRTENVHNKQRLDNVRD